MDARLLRYLVTIILTTTLVNGSLAHAMMFTEVGARPPTLAQASSHEIHRPAACLGGHWGSHCALCALSSCDGAAILAKAAALADGVTPELGATAVIVLSSSRLAYSPPIRAPPRIFLR